MEKSELAALVVKAQGGDREAFNELVRQTVRLVWAQVYGMARDRGLTEDIIQSTFLKAWRSIKTLRDPLLFRAWLMSIARRTAWDLTGEQQKVAEENFDDPFEPAAASANDNSDHVKEKVQVALRKIPEQYRIPLILRYVEGMSRDEISNTIGMQNGALRGILHRGLKLLKDELKKDGSSF